MTKKNLPSLQLLRERNISHRVIELPHPPRNAQDIVRMFGCRLSQVIKTLLFVGDKNVLACVPGDKKVSVSKLSSVAETRRLRLATAQEVSTITGLVVGGVCPFLQMNDVLTVLDNECLEHDTINIGAGTTTLGIELASSDLKQIWPGIVADIVE
jgi:Cys-tRNA(Pro) deacylase